MEYYIAQRIVLSIISIFGASIVIYLFRSYSREIVSCKEVELDIASADGRIGDLGITDEINTENPTAPRSETCLDQATKACLYCGEEILSVAVKCKHCGSILSDSIPKLNAKQSEIVGVIALVLPLCSTILIYGWLDRMPLIYDPGSKLNIIAIATVIITAILVAIEANSVGAGLGSDFNKKGKKSEGPAAWLVANLLVWILAFPWWMARRKKYGLRNYSVLALVLASVFLGMTTLMYTVIEDAKADAISNIEKIGQDFESSLRELENTFNNI